MKKTITLLGLIMLSQLMMSCGDDCYAYSLDMNISLDTSNSLTESKIKVGDKFMVNVFYPPKTTPGSPPPIDSYPEIEIDHLEFETVITFKEYIDQDFRSNKPAIDKFSYQVISGTELEEDTTSFHSLHTDTETHSAYFKPVQQIDGKTLQVEISPLQTGIYYLYFQKPYKFSEKLMGDFDNDGCRNWLSFSYNNTIENDYSFLKNLDLNYDEKDRFLETYSGIAFMVE